VTVSKDLGEASKTENATYGVNKTTRHMIEPAGGIRRLTAAVLVDDVVDRKQDTKGKWVETHHKRSPEDLKLISELAQAAIGFNSARGDVISVQNLSFDRGPAPVDAPPPTMIDKVRKGVNDYSSVVRYAGLVVLFLLVYMLMLRPIQQRALAALPAPSPEAQMAALASPETEATAEAAAAMQLRTQVLKKQLADFVKSEPESSTNAVRAWLREETPS
jgi:flagellar M-ring protein FliF